MKVYPQKMNIINVLLLFFIRLFLQRESQQRQRERAW